VTLTDSNRFGLLGKGSVLLVTSYANRTARCFALVDSGKRRWDAARGAASGCRGFKENKEGEKPKTVREIMVLHRSKPSCNGCHGVMDPLGFAFENLTRSGSGAPRTLGRHCHRYIRPAR